MTDALTQRCLKLLAWVLLSIGLGLLPLSVAADTGHGSGLKPDLRLLIDISGSMKQSDPDNLRAPALELMVRLLPEGAKAGVWIFGEEVQELVPHRIVDAAWKAQALEAMSRIDNSGQRTNIPAALAAATYDFKRMDPGYRTSIVLLTDGKVDVAESPIVNASAARTLLSTQAPELGATGVPVHTIALSDEADWTFLRSLARATTGIAERAQSAVDLSAIFLQSLEMVAPMARVPVSGSQFTIDDSVNEFTALIFFDEGGKRVSLLSPSGKKYSPANSAEEAGNVEWFSTPQFALVTVRSPESGGWLLEAASQSTVRVSVISDLQLEVDPLPNSLPVGRQAELGLRLRERGAVLTDPEVLALFNISVAITDPTGGSRLIDVSRDYPLPADGEYRVLVNAFEQPGRYQALVRVEAKTLQRELPMYVEVAATPEQHTLVTRGQAPPDDDLKGPLAGMLTATVILLLVIWLILRRRKKRKLELWQRRARQSNGTSEFAILLGDTPLDGVSALEDDAPSEQALDPKDANR